MIVDDEMIVRESLYHWFEKYGHVVDTASSGIEALEKLEKFPFELLFVDIKMPGMDGIELLDKVKKEYPDTIIEMKKHTDEAYNNLKDITGDFKHMNNELKKNLDEANSVINLNGNGNRI